MSKIDIVDLIEEYGIPTRWSDLAETYRVGADKDLVQRFQDEFDTINSKPHFYSDYVNLIRKYKGLFNPEVYALRIGRLLQEDINAGIEDNAYRDGVQRVFKAKREVSRQTLIRKLKNMLKKVDVIDFWMDEKSDTNNGRMVLYTSKQFCGEMDYLAKLRSAKEPKLKEIEEQIGLKNVVSRMIPQDLRKVFIYDNFAQAIIQMILNNIDKVQKAAYNGEIDIPGFSVEEIRKVIDSGRVLYNPADIITVLEANANLVDFDRLLALSCALKYNAHGNRFQDFSEEEAAELVDYCDKVESLLDKKNPPVEGEQVITTDFKTIRGSIKTLMRHFIGGQFRSNEELQTIYRDIIEGKMDVSELSKDEYQNRLQISSVLVPEIVSHNPNALVFLSENEYVEEQEIKSVALLMDSYTNEQMDYLVHKGILSPIEVILFYSQGKISLDNIDSVKDADVEKFDEITKCISSNQLISLYTDPERKEEYTRYKQLFKKYLIDGKTQEEKEEVSQDILSQSNDLLEDTVIYDLYHSGLVTLQTTIGFIGVDAVMKTFASGELKPEDCKKLYEEGVLTEELIKDVLMDSKFDEGKKLVLIYSTFSDLEKDRDVRDRMLKYLSDPQEAIREESTGSKRKKSQPGNEKIDEVKTRYITDPVVRFSLIAELDKEYTVEYMQDGHLLFYLPNKGKYLIEKCFDANKNFSYGNATYVMDEALFAAHRDEIVSEGKIKRRQMRLLYEQNRTQASKIIHTGWGKAICRHFDVERPGVYTQDEKNKIEDLAEKVEKAKEVYER